MNKALPVALLIALALCALPLRDMAMASTVFNGIINSDTTWTAESSPYNINGPVAVNRGATLTVEAGATVNFNGYILQVNGTFQALGTDSNPITFQGGGEVDFMPSSSSWSQSAGSGSIIEHTDGLYLIKITGVSPKIDSNRVGNPITVDDEVKVGGIKVYSGSPVITGNLFGDGYYSYIIGLTVAAGSPEVSGNTISRVTVTGGTPTIQSNVVTKGVYIDGGFPSVNGNQIIGPGYPGNYYDFGVSYYSNGITGGADEDGMVISGNTVVNCETGIDVGSYLGKTITVENNLVYNCSTAGIEASSGVTIQGNTIVYCNVSIALDDPCTVSNNNLENYVSNSICLQNAQGAVNAANNWWGTPDTQAISQSIYDSKYNYNLGTVTYLPILAQPNSAAPSTQWTINWSPSQSNVTPIQATATPTSTPIIQQNQPTPTPTKSAASGGSTTRSVGSVEQTILGAAEVVAVALAVGWIIVIAVFVTRRLKRFLPEPAHDEVFHLNVICIEFHTLKR